MKIKTPSPKVLAFLIIVVILTTSAIVSSIFFKKREDSKESLVNLTIKNNLNSQLDPKDSDGDGLADWQEEIWKSDKNNPDSDGDGTNDGEEVNQNRNPIIAGPEDKILSDNEIASQIISESLEKNTTDPNSLTSILSKNLLLRLAQLEQAGQYSTETGDKLAEDLKNQALNEVKIPEKYPESIFLTFDSKDTTKLTQYADSVVTIQINEGVNTNISPDDIEPVIQSLKNIAFQLSVIPVPKEILSVHAKITNNYYIAAEALINLKLSEKDPVLGILSIPVYKKVSEEQPILFKQVQNYLESNGIIFNTN